MLPATLRRDRILFADLLTPITVVLAAFTVVWFVLGLRQYALPRWQELLGLVSVPVATVLHSVGTVVGLLAPPADVRVTRKVPAGDRAPDAPSSTDASSTHSAD
jgi:hypothetical protein